MGVFIILGVSAGVLGYFLVRVVCVEKKVNEVLADRRSLLTENKFLKEKTNKVMIKELMKRREDG